LIAFAEPSSQFSQIEIDLAFRSPPVTMDLKLETLTVSTVAEGVCSVELSRPKALNAMNWTFWTEMRQVFNALAEDGDCRAVIISAQGKAFSAGLDLTDPRNQPPHSDDVARKGLKFISHLKVMQDACTAIELCLKPTVAVVHGNCIGAGIDLITAVDIRLCTADTNFCIKEAAVGLAADVGTLARLPKIVGNDSLVRELSLTARNFAADEAKDCGLVSRVLPSKDQALEEALRIATLIAANSPVAVVGTKKNLIYARDHTVQDSLDYVTTWNTSMLQTEDTLKAMAAAMKKQKPTFSKL